jgi:hypothetical protein
MLVCYEQSWGHSTTDLTGLTWCRSDNPTIAPLRLPPPADATSIAFDVRPCADESNPNATCKTVVKVSSLGWTQGGEANSFVLSGMLDGHFIIASFTNDSVRFLESLTSVIFAEIAHLPTDEGLTAHQCFVFLLRVF